MLETYNIFACILTEIEVSYIKYIVLDEKDMQEDLERYIRFTYYPDNIVNFVLIRIALLTGYKPPYFIISHSF